MHTQKLNLWYGTFQALFEVDLEVKQGIITSLIGPSGYGKSTFLRCVNRINERLGYVRTTGQVDVLGHNIYALDVELVQVRKRVGMVFQRSNPLPLSIRDNIIFGYRLHTDPSKKLSKSKSDECVFMLLGEVIEHGETADIFVTPQDSRTSDYIEGRYG